MRFIDMHCDTIWELMKRKNETLKENSLCIDVKKLKTANSLVQFFACFIYMKDFEGEGQFTKAYQHAFNMLAFAKQEFAANSQDLALALEFNDILENQQEGRISAILTLEEGGVIENDMCRLTQLYEEGIRLITLTWNCENCIGFPNSRDAKIMQQGLKPFGMEVVERMNELGMIIDVSHMSDGGFWDVIRLSKKPIVASHSNARTLCNHPRNLSDEMIQALAEKGGIAGVNFYPYFLCERGKASAEDIARHVVHMYQVGGEDVVAIGTDFDGFDEGELEIAHIGEMNQVYEAIRKCGFTERQMEKFWSHNALRVMKEVIN